MFGYPSRMSEDAFGVGLQMCEADGQCQNPRNTFQWQPTDRPYSSPTNTANAGSYWLARNSTIS